MKYMKFNRLSYLLALSLSSLIGCQKNDSLNQSEEGIISAEIAVAGINAGTLTTAKVGAATPADSLYVIFNCSKGSRRDTIAASSLPSVVTSYLTTNYNGYTFQQAYSISRNNVVSGYVVVIVYNANPVAVQFDAAGNFVKVLEQREGKDRHGKGWHDGGRFDDRDGKRRDTVAIAALPVQVSSYFTTNYPADTLVAAFRNKDSSLLVISKNNAAFATVFSSTGSFIRRTALQTKASRVTVVEQAALPSNLLNYLSSTYPAYVLKKAFIITPGTTVQGYIIIIDASGTKYAIQFDGSGNFVRSVTVR